MRSTPKPFTTRTPVTLSSTTPDTSDSSFCSCMPTGYMRWLKRVAEKLSNGSRPSANSASPGLRSTRMTTTATIWIVLAIVSGTSSTTLLICWMSVFAYAINWPVCAWSWNAKCRRCRCATSRMRMSVSTRHAETERGVAPQTRCRPPAPHRPRRSPRSAPSVIAMSPCAMPWSIAAPASSGTATRAAAHTSPATMPRSMSFGCGADRFLHQAPAPFAGLRAFEPFPLARVRFSVVSSRLRRPPRARLSARL